MTPISKPMVVAILDGRKTQTRRVIKPQPVFREGADAARGGDWEWHGGMKLKRAGYGAPYIHSNRTAVEAAMLKVCRHPVGSRIWVKETFAYHACAGLCDEVIHYRAEGESCPNDGESLKWKPSIFMPRWASRITLEVTAVRVEKLNEISARDCIDEGIDYEKHKCGCEVCAISSKICPATTGTLIEAYKDIWESIHGPGEWALNPWVWAYTFRRV